MSKKVFAILSLSLLTLAACKTTADLTEEAPLDSVPPVVEEDIDAAGDVTDFEEPSADADAAADTDGTVPADAEADVSADAEAAAAVDAGTEAAQ